MIWPPGVFLFYHFQKMSAKSSQSEFSQQEVENSTAQELSIVKFHQTKLSCCKLPNGQIMVAIKPICDAIGIDGKHALLTIKQDTFLGSKVGIYTLLDAKKRNFPMQCIPLQYVHGWLFSIQEGRVKGSAKEKLIQFKEECYQVLFDHFYGKYKVYEENLNRRRLLISQLGVATANKSLYDVQIRDIKKQLAQIEEEEITGQLKLIK